MLLRIARKVISYSHHCRRYKIDGAGAADSCYLYTGVGVAGIVRFASLGNIYYAGIER